MIWLVFSWGLTAFSLFLYFREIKKGNQEKRDIIKGFNYIIKEKNKTILRLSAEFEEIKKQLKQIENEIF